MISKTIVSTFFLLSTTAVEGAIKTSPAPHSKVATITAAGGATITTMQCGAATIDFPDDSVLTLEGIELPDMKEISSSLPLPPSSSVILDNNVNEETKKVTLYRNGEGIRNINIFGFDYNVYVAGLWTINGGYTTLDEIMDCSRPKQMDFTFLRGFSKDKVAMAWRRQYDYSVTHRTYDTYEEDRQKFIAMFDAAIEKGGTYSVVMIGDDTYIIDQGTYKGMIQGRNFQRSFLSMFLGSSPVTENLKSGLLSGRRRNDNNNCASSSSSEQQHDECSNKSSKTTILA